ncbi:hypothetical protein [Streptomyces sp. NPDC051657]|uniref:hypothetical protein n=1 Tax=unclassified Streptomyces TaxID=2593676 RepID=UPI0034407E4C
MQEVQAVHEVRRVRDALEAIAAVDWDGLPGPADPYDPARAAAGLRALATATGLVRAADAGALLAGGGLVHDHSGAVFPAAVVAAPLLLAVARHGRPEAGATALGLLDDALAFATRDGSTRVATPYAEAVPICCALADHLRGGADVLATRGREGRRLLADAAEHWRFDVQEVVAEGDGTAAFGALAGRFPDGTRAAELHRTGRATVLARVVLHYPPQPDGGSDACLRVDGLRPGELAPPAVLFPARCGPGPTGG